MPPTRKSYMLTKQKILLSGHSAYLNQQSLLQSFSDSETQAGHGKIKTRLDIRFEIDVHLGVRMLLSLLLCSTSSDGKS